MKKNVAGQFVGVQMITIADGTAFTGAVSVSIVIDNGAPAAGTGGSVVHKSGGYHTYTPTQGESNGDFLSFSFSGTGAVPVTIQVFTGFPQTIDNNTLQDVRDAMKLAPTVGAPAAGSIDEHLDNIFTHTTSITGDLDNGGRLDLILDAILDAVGTSGVIISAGTAVEIADALLKRDLSSVSGEATRSPLNALRILRNKWSSNAGVLTVTKEDDASVAWTGALVSDAAAEPVISMDPA